MSALLIINVYIDVLYNLAVTLFRLVNELSSFFSSDIWSYIAFSTLGS